MTERTALVSEVPISPLCSSWEPPLLPTLSCAPATTSRAGPSSCVRQWDIRASEAVQYPARCETTSVLPCHVSLQHYPSCRLTGSYGRLVPTAYYFTFPLPSIPPSEYPLPPPPFGIFDVPSMLQTPPITTSRPTSTSINVNWSVISPLLSDCLRFWDCSIQSWRRPALRLGSSGSQSGLQPPVEQVFRQLGLVSLIQPDRMPCAASI